MNKIEEHQKSIGEDEDTGRVKIKDVEWKLLSELMKNSRRSDRELAKGCWCLAAYDKQTDQGVGERRLYQGIYHDTLVSQDWLPFAGIDFCASRKECETE
jgi:hypothetical protein